MWSHPLRWYYSLFSMQNFYKTESLQCRFCLKNFAKPIPFKNFATPVLQWKTLQRLFLRKNLLDKSGLRDWWDFLSERNGQTGQNSAELHDFVFKTSFCTKKSRQGVNIKWNLGLKAADFILTWRPPSCAQAAIIFSFSSFRFKADPKKFFLSKNFFYPRKIFIFIKIFYLK